jgi:hypothetical protein
MHSRRAKSGFWGLEEEILFSVDIKGDGFKEFNVLWVHGKV